MFNYALNPYITDSNIYGSLITGLDSGREGLTNYCVGSIKQDPCPPNIGIGIFEKQRQAELSNIRSVNAGFQKAFSVMAYGSALIDVGVGVRNNLASDAPFKKWPLMQQWMLYIPEVQYLSPQKQARLLGDASVDQLARLWVFLLVI